MLDGKKRTAIHKKKKSRRYSSINICIQIDHSFLRSLVRCKGSFLKGEKSLAICRGVSGFFFSLFFSSTYFSGIIRFRLSFMKLFRPKVSSVVRHWVGSFVNFTCHLLFLNGALGFSPFPEHAYIFHPWISFLFSTETFFEKKWFA